MTKENDNLIYELKQLYLTMEVIADKIEDQCNKENADQLRGAAFMIKDDWIPTIEKDKITT